MLQKLRSRRFALIALFAVVITVVGNVALAVREANRGAAVVRSGPVFLADESKRPRVEFPSAQLLDGGRFEPASIAGEVAVVNFWASWCAPCEREAPVLRELAGLYPDVRFLGVDAMEARSEPARHFVEVHQLKYPNIFDENGAVQLAFSRKVTLRALPVTVVLDRQGRVGGVLYGEARYTELDTLIRQVTGQL